MKTLPLTHQNSPRKWPILPVLLGLDAFVTGGLAALLTVNRLLQKTANAYAPYNMDAASTVLDLMDKLLPYLFPCSALLLFLVLITTAVGVWLKARSQTVRYGVTALVLVALLLSATGVGVWILKASETPSVLPMTPTPTPTPAEGARWKPRVPEALVVSLHIADKSITLRDRPNSIEHRKMGF